MQKLYNQVKRDQWRSDEYAMPVIARYGTGGGNMPIVLEVLPFDTTQITHKANYSHPTWGGGCCHPLASGAHPPAVVIRETEHGESDDT